MDERWSAAVTAMCTHAGTAQLASTMLAEACIKAGMSEEDLNDAKIVARTMSRTERIQLLMVVRALLLDAIDEFDDDVPMELSFLKKIDPNTCDHRWTHTGEFPMSGGGNERIVCDLCGLEGWD